MSSESIDVSVYILTYYHEHFLAQAIESVLRQKTHFKYEIVISDDCSKDKTQSIIAHYAKLYPDIIRPIYNKENLGIPKNIFQARTHCRGKYIVVLAGDDYWINDQKIEIQATFLDKHPEYVAVFNGTELRYDNDQSPYAVLPPESERNREFTIKDYEKGGVLRSHGFMMRNLFLNPSDREYFRQAQSISDKVDDAVDMVLLLLKGRVYIINDITDAHRVIRSDKEERHNYNSKYKRFDKIKYYIQLLNNLDHFVNKDTITVSLKNKYKSELVLCLIDMFLCGRYKEHLALMKSIPDHYKRPFYKSVYIFLLPEAILFATKRVLSF